MSVGEMSIGEMSIGEMSIGEMSRIRWPYPGVTPHPSVLDHQM